MTNSRLSLAFLVPIFSFVATFSVFILILKYYRTLCIRLHTYYCYLNLLGLIGSKEDAKPTVFRGFCIGEFLDILCIMDVQYFQGI